MHTDLMLSVNNFQDKYLLWINDTVFKILYKLCELNRQGKFNRVVNKLADFFF